LLNTQAVTEVNLTWQAVIDMNLTWQALTIVNFTGHSGAPIAGSTLRSDRRGKHGAEGLTIDY
jgi:hypothetical protein